MYNHKPDNYVCPFCLIVRGVENEHVLTKQEDVVFKDELVTAFIGAGWWKNNKGHVIIISNKHYENIYDLPIEYIHRVHEIEKKVALALKEVYKCDGVSSRQHNEPYGNQDVWHYHLHVFPRYKDDYLYGTERELSNPEERVEYAMKLRSYFSVVDKN